MKPIYVFVFAVTAFSETRIDYRTQIRNLPTERATPELPRIYLEAPAPIGACTRTLLGTEDLQAVIDAAAYGDVICAPSTATWNGNYVLRAKSGVGWVTLAGASGTGRVSASLTAPKITTPNGAPAITTESKAHGYRFVGWEITATGPINDLVVLGNNETVLAELPYDFIFERCYIHGLPGMRAKRGIAANARRVQVVDSRISEIHVEGQDTQAIAAWNSSGPFRIINNYLEAAGENVMFGGAAALVPGLTPSNIEFRGNHLFKPLSWKTAAWTVKNLFELKHAQRVLIDGNVFENCWASAQNGFAFQFTVRAEFGTNPWAVVQDVTMTNNIVRNADSGVNILGLDGNSPSGSQGKAGRFLFAHNFFDHVGDVDGSRWFELLSGANDITISHNTTTHGKTAFLVAEGTSSRLIFTNNITPIGLYGISGKANISDAVLAANVFVDATQVGGWDKEFPGNFIAASPPAIGYVSATDYRLAPTSAFTGKSLDGMDPGADIELVLSKTAGVAQ